MDVYLFVGQRRTQRSAAAAAAPAPAAAPAAAAAAATTIAHLRRLGRVPSSVLGKTDAPTKAATTWWYLVTEHARRVRDRRGTKYHERN